MAGTVDRLALPEVRSAIRDLTSRGPATLAYFASTDDVCRAYASLAALARRPGLSPIGQVLSIHDGGLGLDPTVWKTTWFKGGHEVSAAAWALAENPSQSLKTAARIILSAIKGAFALAADR